jgi:hypothetical protein
LPEISPTDNYTLYFSKGYYREGEAVARYLSQNPDMISSGNIVQVLGSGPEAKAWAAGFQKAWAAAGRNSVMSVVVGRDQQISAEWLSKFIPRGRVSALLLWTGPESYEALRSLAAGPDRRFVAFLSSTLLAEQLWDLPSEVRSFTYVSYPFREPGEKKLPARMGRPRPIVVNKEFRKNDHRVASRTATAAAVLNEALTRMERNFYRDYLLDLMDTSEVQDTSDYELLNFGPGRRYVSEDCYIMRLSDGRNPSLISMRSGEEE